MKIIQDIRFLLQLSLSESYIYGTATIDGKHYSINIQQLGNRLIVLPSDFEIDEPNNALISFIREADSNKNNKMISMTSEVQVGQGDLIEVYLDQDEMLLSLAKDLPAEITIQMNTIRPVYNEGR
jgi:hypothetical protein